MALDMHVQLCRPPSSGTYGWKTGAGGSFIARQLRTRLDQLSRRQAMSDARLSASEELGRASLETSGCDARPEISVLGGHRMVEVPHLLE